MAVFSFSFPKLKLGHREKQGRLFEMALFFIGHVFEVAIFLSGDVFDLGYFPARQGNISGEISGSYLKYGGMEKVLLFRPMERGAGELYKISSWVMRDLFIQGNH